MSVKLGLRQCMILGYWQTVMRRMFVPKKQELKDGWSIKVGNLAVCTPSEY